MTIFLSMSLSAGVLILLTALLRRFAGNRLPRRMYVALWDIAVLRLLVPLALPKRFSISALFPSPSVTETVTESAFMQADILYPQMTASETPVTLSGISSNQTNILIIVWAVVALALAVYFVAAYLRSTRAFAQSLPDDDPRCAAFLCAHPTKRRVQIRISSRIASPLSYGLLHPVILLPKGMNRDGLPFVLEHEMMHIRALDAWRKLFVLAALCLHWFNPTVFILFLLVNRDMELLCDERVLMQRATSSKRAYALTLLDMEAARSAAPTMSCFRMTGIEERILAMKNVKKNTPLTRLVASTLVVASCFGMVSAVPPAARRIRHTATSFITEKRQLPKKRRLPNPTACPSSGGRLKSLRSIWRRRAKILKNSSKPANAATRTATAGSPGHRKKLRRPWLSMKKCWMTSSAA